MTEGTKVKIIGECSYKGHTGIVRKLLLKNEFSEVYDVELDGINKHIVFDISQLRKVNK